MSDLLVEAIPGSSFGWASLDEMKFRCALGRGGIASDKTEGDGCTPAGRFPIRRLIYRPDRVRETVFGVPVQPMAPSDGWCDDPSDAAYNQLVTRPYPARHEVLWREDPLYDLLLVVGHNDAPCVSGKGSAVFLHLAHPDYRPTDGCIAFARADLLSLLAALEPTSAVVVGYREQRP